MAFCPKCRYEYVSGVMACPDCGSVLVDSLPSLEQPTHKRELITVYTGSNPTNLAMVKSFLEAAGFECFVDGQRFANLYPTLTSLGEAELQVPSDRAEEARLLLEELNHTDLTASTEPPVS